MVGCEKCPIQVALQMRQNRRHVLSPDPADRVDQVAGEGAQTRPRYSEVIAFAVLGALGLAYAHADLGRESLYYAVFLPQNHHLAAAVTAFDAVGARSLRPLDWFNGLVVESGPTPAVRDTAEALGAWLVVPLDQAYACTAPDDVNV